MQHLLGTALLFFLLPSLVVSVFFQAYTNWALSANYGLIVLDSVSRVASQMEYRIELYEMLIEGVARNEALNEQLAHRYGSMMENWTAVRTVEQSFVYVYDMLPGILDFRIYHQNDSLVEDGGILWRPEGRNIFREETDTDWYRRVRARKQREWRIWVDPRTAMPGSEAFLSTRVGITPDAVANGAVLLRLSLQRAFGDVLAPTRYADSSFVVADAGAVLLATHARLVGADMSDTPFADLAQEEGVVDEVMNLRSGVGTRVRLGNGWTLYGMIPLEALRASTQHSALLQLLCAVGLVLIGVLSILLMGRNISMRLKRLDQTMRTFSHGEMNVSLQADPSDELGAVEERFNRMARRLQDLVAQVEERKRREMEEAIRAMESYVNPHFLYNTLSLIRWRALDDQDEELCALVDDMTTYYRLSLSGGRSVVLVGDEIAHLEAYIAIQQRRYNDSVCVLWQVDEPALEAYTPKNILQTLVENSYVHGLIPEKPGNRIDITVKTDGLTVRFEIADNGVGMEAERLQTILSDTGDVNPGIGIRSVRQRLGLYFGNKMKMEIFSRPQEGTRVVIEIPYCLEEPSAGREG